MILLCALQSSNAWEYKLTYSLSLSQITFSSHAYSISLHNRIYATQQRGLNQYTDRMINPRGFVDPQPMTIAAKEGFDDNYNDDFYPKHEKIVKLIHEKSSSLILLHGKPGTGKTTYIRQLIKDNPDVMFYWIDCSLFKQFTSSEFIDFIRSCKNSVFVVEDAEFLLESRDSAGGNLAMQTLLNISDGMLGDSLHLKFICTFNTEDKIDPALLRKGRMKMKYEFKPLEVDRVNNLFKKLGIKAVAKEPMPLADVYNYEEDNGTQNEEKRKIGFK